MSLMLFAACTVAALCVQTYTLPPVEPDYKDVMRQVLVYAHHIVKDINKTEDV